VATIRPAISADAEAVRAIYAPYVLETAISFETEVPSVEEMAHRIGTCGRTHSWLVCEDAEGLAGYVYAGRHAERAAYRWSTDVTVYTHSRAHRRGVGRGLYTALFGQLRLLGYYTAYGGITQPNDASMGLHKSMGFQPVAYYEAVGFKFAAWHDVAWLALRLQPLADTPAEPHDPAEVSQTEEWTQAMRAGERLIRL
jgi:L-amino acid N-acyltransferase YncA